MPWKVVLIVEDDSDGRAILEFARRHGLTAAFDWLSANGIGNIKRNAPRLISLAAARLTGRGGCVAVVVDLDRRNPARDEPHRTIAEACRRGKPEFVGARETLEAWFLADAGICAWLGIRATGRTDALRDPKGLMERAFYQKTGRPYRKRRARLEVASRAAGVDVTRSDSARDALRVLRRCHGNEAGRTT